MAEFKIFYRISDQSYPKPRLPGSDKQVCLDNFLWAFREYRGAVTVIADNCHESTLAMVERRGLPILRTALGNAGSFRFALTNALECPPDTLAYLIEDDYLHHPGAAESLLAAAESGFSDYYTLYDHPDKYSNLYGMGECSQVRRVDHQHWRYTVSTTMTFACRVARLARDRQIWFDHTADRHPNDCGAFVEIAGAGGKLAVAIPGLACHLDMTWGLVQGGQVAMEPWVLSMLASGGYCASGAAGPGP